MVNTEPTDLLPFRSKTSTGKKHMQKPFNKLLFETTGYMVDRLLNDFIIQAWSCYLHEKRLRHGYFIFIFYIYIFDHVARWPDLQMNTLNHEKHRSQCKYVTW